MPGAIAGRTEGGTSKEPAGRASIDHGLVARLSTGLDGRDVTRTKLARPGLKILRKYVHSAIWAGMVNVLALLRFMEA